MKQLLSSAILTVTLLSACTYEDPVVGAPQPGSAGCTIDGQKQFVLDQMRTVYYWYRDLPPVVDLSQYPTPEALLDYLTSFQPLDGFSYIDLAEADAQFFGEGQYEGFGFSSRFDAPGELRLTRVFASSPANSAGLARGQRILMLNGRTIADIEANEGVDALFSLPMLEFTLQRPDLSEFTVTVNQGLVTIDPVPQFRIIDRPDGTSVGYMELSTFISTAEPEFMTVFSQFASAGVNDVIVDLRYNSGGLVVTTELLGDYLGGGVANGTVFSRTLFNDQIDELNRVEFFESVANSVNLSRLVVIATDRTASASELVTNSLIPHAAVSVVGSSTFGKPVGQLGIEFCDKILRPTSFETVNSDGGGGYFGGIPADCAADDDLAIPIGDDADPNLVAALSLLDTGACPAVTAAPPGDAKPRISTRRAGRDVPPWREYAGAW